MTVFYQNLCSSEGCYNEVDLFCFKSKSVKKLTLDNLGYRMVPVKFLQGTQSHSL